MSACVCVVSRAGARVTPEIAGSRYAEEKEAEEGGQEVEKDVRCQAVEGEGHDGPDGDDEGEGREGERERGGKGEGERGKEEGRGGDFFFFCRIAERRSSPLSIHRPE